METSTKEKYKYGAKLIKEYTLGYGYYIKCKYP
jgi:hypothetical protein